MKTTVPSNGNDYFKTRKLPFQNKGCIGYI